MQTLLNRLGALLTSLPPFAEQPESPKPPASQFASRHDDDAVEDRLPARDESWYWSMHAHW